MATVTRAEPAPAAALPSVPAERRILLRNIPWELYEALRAIEENWHVRMAYDAGSLELMSPSLRHDGYEYWFDQFITTIADVLDFEMLALRTTTWKRSREEKGKEADACYYLANFERVRGKEIDLAVDPPPDLAVEIEISRGALDSLPIYAALRVPEVWRFDGEALHIHVLQPDGTYLESERSPALPFLRPGEVERWMRRADELGAAVRWTRELRAWAIAELRPRLGPA